MRLKFTETRRKTKCKHTEHAHIRCAVVMFGLMQFFFVIATIGVAVVVCRRSTSCLFTLHLFRSFGAIA